MQLEMRVDRTENQLTLFCVTEMTPSLVEVGLGFSPVRKNDIIHSVLVTPLRTSYIYNN
jgi:hypothetical protein